MRFTKTKLGMIPALFAGSFCIAVPASAQDAPGKLPEIIFQPGTGDAPPPRSTPFPSVRTSTIACADLSDVQARLFEPYGKMEIAAPSPEFADAVAPPAPQPANRLDRTLLQTALASYRRHNCAGGIGSGPSDIIVVDFAKRSDQPRLYAINLLTGAGIDTPIAVAHGIGSDRNDDGIADFFSNVPSSLASSLGAARGAELYHGQNGLSLRLDGLDWSNSNMRYRDIVAHSYGAERRRYFNASLLQARAGKPGTSEGCFVVAPEYRDWLFGMLGNGGFLFAGLSGERAKEMDPPAPLGRSVDGQIVFVPGTGG